MLCCRFLAQVTFHSRYLVLCLQVLGSSFLLFRLYIYVGSFYLSITQPTRRNLRILKAVYHCITNRQRNHTQCQKDTLVPRRPTEEESTSRRSCRCHHLSYNGAETCELIGLFILSQINTIIITKEDVGIYRDD